MASLKQQQYRKLMKEQKAASSKKKIDHPLARYNSLGQINCVVCNVIVKSEVLWNTHLQSRKHKDSVTSLKSQKVPSSSNTEKPQLAAKIPQTTESEFLKPSAPLIKRKAPTSEEPDAPSPKKQKTEPKPPKKKKNKNTPRTPTSDSPSASGLPSDFFDAGVSKRFKGHGEEDYGSDSDEDMPITSSSSSNSQPQSSSNVTKDNKSKDPNTSNVKGQSKNGGVSTDSLPEGFFDDPKLDAKARKVEYKDALTEEWEKFQKSIQKEDDVSEALLVEGDEESKEEREHVEVKEQVFWFTKAEELRVKQEQVLSKRQQQQATQSTAMDTDNPNDNNSSDDEDLDFDEFLDWRAKMS